MAITLGLLFTTSFANGVAVAGEVQDTNNKTVIVTGNLPKNPTADGRGSMAMGSGANANGTDTISIGTNSKATKDSATAMGYDSEATGARATATGYNANASGTGSVAVGSGANATNDTTAAIGAASEASGAASVALGAWSESSGLRATAVGSDAEASGSGSVALGTYADSSGDFSLALGQESSSSGTCSLAAGVYSDAGGDYSLAFGRQSNASGNQAVSLGLNTDVSADYSVAIGSWSKATEALTVSVGDVDMQRRIVNVAAGRANTDAVNVGQLNTAVANEKTERIAAINAEATERENADARLEQRVDEMERGLDGRFDKLDSKIDKVGAGAAALAALHPLDYDPDDKLNFAVGLGNYRGEQAAALDAFYRPNETIMLSVGGTMGNNDNMVNLGVSFALDGRRAKAKESRAKLEAKLENMSGELAEVKAQLALLMQQSQEKK